MAKEHSIGDVAVSLSLQSGQLSVKCVLLASIISSQLFSARIKEYLCKEAYIIRQTHMVFLS